MRILRCSILPLSLVIIALACFCSSCGPRITAEVLRAHIRESADWMMVEECTSEGCYPKMDFLIGDDIRIKFTSLNERTHNAFLFRLDIFAEGQNDYKFNPSHVSGEFKDGTTTSARAFNCSTRLDRLRSTPADGREIPIDDESGCLYLLFDVDPAVVGEEFTMKINGLTRMGHPVVVPHISFRKGYYRW